MAINKRVLCVGLSCLASFAATSIATGSELAPLAGESLRLANVTGTVYYTEQPDGFQVVTTLAQEEGPPVRVVVTLQPGQKQIVSVPRGVGEPALVVEISHAGDHINVTRGPKLAALSE